jgi:cyclic beta-1,2-glucan synthetase
MYEAVDYTKERLAEGHEFMPVQSFYSHHSGMTMLALAAALLDSPMQKLFYKTPELRAAVSLLEEKYPHMSLE